MTGETDISSTVKRVVEALAAGQVVIIPTDTVYGLAADPTSPDAMRRLFELKERPEGVPVAVLVGSADQASELVNPSPAFVELAAKHWPGALTLVADGSAVGRELQLGEVRTVGVRVPDHDLIRACANAFGPIAATSANRHGEPTIVDPTELDSVFGRDVEVIIKDEVLNRTASTVVDVTVDPPRVLRQGVVFLGHDN